MLLSEIFKVDHIKMDLQSTDKEELFEEMITFLFDCEDLGDREMLLNKFWQREKKMTTGIASGIALPHTHIENIEGTVGVMGISRKGIDYDSLDGKPVYVVMMLVGKVTEPEGHLKVLKNIAVLMTNPEFYPTLMKCKTPREVYDTIIEFEDIAKFAEKK
jgi:PTS system fructose-specific IIC component/PTS system nitrogen regulatory IIA component